MVAVEPAHAGPLAHAQGVAAQGVVAHRHAVLHFLPGPDEVGGGRNVVGPHFGHGGALDPLARFVVAIGLGEQVAALDLDQPVLMVPFERLRHPRFAQAAG